jgi:Fe-Mn family superoxide dismutase
LEEIIKESAGDASKVAIFNNAAQVWNHSFFWACMKKDGGGKPSGELLQQIEKDFGDFESFATEFKQAAATQFGSGWAWLVWDGSKLSIMKTANADLPMVHNKKAVLTIDVWEHAYYLDYQNKRPDYIGIFLEKLVNWDFALQNLQTQL